MREHGNGDGLHVVGHEVVATVRERTRLRDPQQRDPGARARTEVEPRVRPRLAQERDDVAAEAVLDVHLARLLGEADHLVGARDGA